MGRRQAGAVGVCWWYQQWGKGEAQSQDELGPSAHPSGSGRHSGKLAECSSGATGIEKQQDGARHEGYWGLKWIGLAQRQELWSLFFYFEALPVNP